MRGYEILQRLVSSALSLAAEEDIPGSGRGSNYWPLIAVFMPTATYTRENTASAMLRKSSDCVEGHGNKQPCGLVRTGLFCSHMYCTGEAEESRRWNRTV